MQTSKQYTEARYDERVREDAAKWTAQFSKHFTHACTASFHQPKSKHELYIEQIWKNWSEFCKYLNRLAYGHAGKRGKKTLLIVASLEGRKNGKNLHMHIALGCVDGRYNYDELTVLFNKAWRKVSWTLNDTHIQPYRNIGWNNYAYKESVWLDLQAGDLAYACIPPTLTAKVPS